MSQSTVKLYGQTAGYLTWDQKDKIGVFEFEENCSLPFAPFHSNVRIIEGVKSHLRIEDKLNTFKGLPTFLADSLPDAWGNRVIDSWIRSKNLDKKSFTPVDRLNYLGDRGMGAFEFHPMMDKQKSHGSKISIDELVLRSICKS